MKIFNKIFILILAIFGCLFFSFELFAQSMSDDDIVDNIIEYNWTLYSFIATVCGIIAALITLWWMIKNSKRENVNFSKQLDELKKQTEKADQQIQNQEKEYREASDRSIKLNTSLKENVEDIKEYLTKKDLIIKLTEKKDTIYGTFKALWNSSLTKSAASVKDGTIVHNTAVMSGIITITTGITTFKDLLPEISGDFEEACKQCIDDVEQLSKIKKKGEDIAEWLKGVKTHFDDLDKEMSNCINNL